MNKLFAILKNDRVNEMPYLVIVIFFLNFYSIFVVVVVNFLLTQFFFLFFFVVLLSTTIITTKKNQNKNFIFHLKTSMIDRSIFNRSLLLYHYPFLYYIHCVYLFYLSFVCLLVFVSSWKPILMQN